MEINFGRLPRASAIFSSAWQLVKNKSRIVYLLALLSMIPAILITLNALLFAVPSSAYNPNPPQPMAFTITFVVIMLIGIIFGIWIQLALYAAIIYDVDFQGAFRAVKGKYGGFIWVSFLVGLIATIGYILLVIPGIIFSIWYSLAGFVFLVEGLRGMKALHRSQEYIKGRTGTVLGKMIFIGVIYVLFLIIGAVLKATISPAAQSVYNLILAFAFLPILPAYQYVLYHHLKETMPVAPVAPAPVPAPPTPVTPV